MGEWGGREGETGEGEGRGERKAKVKVEGSARRAGEAT